MIMKKCWLLVNIVELSLVENCNHPLIMPITMKYIIISNNDITSSKNHYGLSKALLSICTSYIM